MAAGTEPDVADLADGICTGNGPLQTLLFW